MKNTKRRPRRGPVTPPSQRPEPTAQPRPGPAHDRRTWLVAIPMVLVVAAAFFPALGNGFVDWDDEANFLRNGEYRGLGWPQVKWAWTTFLLGVYQPVAWMLLEVQYVLFGLDPRGYHLTSLLLHAANVVVLYALALALLVRCRPDPFLRDPWAGAVGAGLATALFAVHPLRVEPVAWVSCQPYLPCAFFAMLAVLAYLRAVGDGPRRWGWLAGSLVLFAAALLSKAAAIGLPAVLAILDVYPLRRAGGGPGRWLGPEARRVWLEKLPFVAISLVFIGLAVAARADAHTLVLREDDGIAARVGRACYGAWFYLVKTAIPRDITAFYPLPPRIDRLAVPFAASIVATLAVSVGLFLMRGRWPGLLAAWLSYLVLLAPSSGLVRIGPQLAADRYSYLTLVGLVIPAAAGLGLAWAALRRSRARAVAITAVAGVVVPVLVLLTWGQCRIWRDSEALWSHVLDHGGGSSTAHGGLGLARLSRGEYAEAKAHFDEAVRLDPNDPMGHNDLATLLASCPEAKYRDGKEAVAAAARACELTAWSQPMCLDTLAAAYAEAGDFAAAIARQEQAIGLLPDGPRKDAYRSRLALYRAGKPYREPAPAESPTGASP